MPYAEFSDPQSLNLYSYVRNIPTTRFDADGHDPREFVPFVVNLEQVRNLGHALWNFITNPEPDHIPGMPPPPACSCPNPSDQDNKKDANNNSKSDNQQNSGGQQKKVPNPNGKKGDARHQQKIADIEKGMKDRGLKTKREFKIDTPNGEKSSRYVDVVGQDDQGNVVEMHQVGKQTKAGNPVSRETKALNDIEKQTGQRPQFHPTNDPHE